MSYLQDLIGRLQLRAEQIPGEVAARENEASGHCGSYGTETAADYLNDQDRQLMMAAEMAIKLLNLQPIATVPRDETWVWLYGDLHDEPHGKLAFWSESGEDWFDSECASNSVTCFEWQPTHWAPFERPTVQS